MGKTVFILLLGMLFFHSCGRVKAEDKLEWSLLDTVYLADGGNSFFGHIHEESSSFFGYSAEYCQKDNGEIKGGICRIYYRYSYKFKDGKIQQTNKREIKADKIPSFNFDRVALDAIRFGKLNQSKKMLEIFLGESARKAVIYAHYSQDYSSFADEEISGPPTPYFKITILEKGFEPMLLTEGNGYPVKIEILKKNNSSVIFVFSAISCGNVCSSGLSIFKVQAP